MNDKLREWSDGLYRNAPEEKDDETLEDQDEINNPEAANDEKIEEAANDEKLEEEQKSQLSDEEQRAVQMGWQPKNNWDGDPDDWTSAKRFIQTGEVIQANKTLHSKIDRMQYDFENRIQSLQTLHDNKLKFEIETLKSKRDQAANDADIDTYNSVNKQIDNLEQNKQQPEAPQQDQQVDIMQKIVETPVVQKFVTENPWIAQQGAKGVYGQKIFNDWIQSNMNNKTAVLEDGLKTVQEAVAKEFPQSNPNRNVSQSMGTRSGGPKKTAQTNRLTMNDLNHQERLIWNSMGNSWKDEKDFLQAVADDRAQ